MNLQKWVFNKISSEVRGLISHWNIYITIILHNGTKLYQPRLRLFYQTKVSSNLIFLVHNIKHVKYAFFNSNSNTSMTKYINLLLKYKRKGKITLKNKEIFIKLQYEKREIS